jgi:magnesium transporter
MSAVQCYHYHGKRCTQSGTVAEALRLRQTGGFVWLDFDDPEQADLAALIEPLELHPLSVEDCFDEQQIPKMEDFAGYTFVLFNTYSYSAGTLGVDEVDFFLGRDFLVTVRGHQATDRLFFADLPGCIERRLDAVCKGPDMLMHAILDYIVDRKFAAIDRLQEEADHAEMTVLEDLEGFKPQRLLHIRQHLLELRKSLFHEREVLTKICRRDCPFISDKGIYSYRDAYDHLAKFFEFIEITREMVSNLVELHLTQQNNRLTLAANQTNQVMKRLTLINTIFMPLTLLAGIGGMSEYSMMTGATRWPIAYPLLLAGLALIAVVNYFYLRWIRWV